MLAKPKLLTAQTADAVTAAVVVVPGKVNPIQNIKKTGNSPPNDNPSIGESEALIPMTSQTQLKTTLSQEQHNLPPEQRLQRIIQLLTRAFLDLSTMRAHDQNSHQNQPVTSLDVPRTLRLNVPRSEPSQSETHPQRKTRRDNL